MSRRLRARRVCLLSLLIPCLSILLAGALCPSARAGVVRIKGNTYSLDGGRPVTGAWEVAEKIAVANDVAVVVLDSQASPVTIQTLLQLLENLHVPTLFTKQADYKALLARGVIKPTRTPSHP